MYRCRDVLISFVNFQSQFLTKSQHLCTLNKLLCAPVIGGATTKVHVIKPVSCCTTPCPVPPANSELRENLRLPTPRTLVMFESSSFPVPVRRATEQRAGDQRRGPQRFLQDLGSVQRDTQGFQLWQMLLHWKLLQIPHQQWMLKCPKLLVMLDNHPK